MWVLQDCKAIGGLERSNPVPCRYSIVYKNPSEAVGAAKFERMPQNGQLVSPLESTDGQSATWILNDIAKTLQIRGQIGVGWPLLLNDHVS